MKLLSKIAIFFIRLYQIFISPILSKWVHCKFYPSCSKYSILCIEKYGFYKGIDKTIKRLGKCNKYNLDSCIDLP